MHGTWRGVRNERHLETALDRDALGTDGLAAAVRSQPPDRSPTLSDEQLKALQQTTIHYYFKEVSPDQRLDRGQDPARAPSSIAAVGMALSRPRRASSGSATARRMAAWTLKTLRFFAESRQGPEPDATGYKGFYYHFLDMESGRRVWNCELSTVDSAFLFAGMLAAATYFDRRRRGRARDPRARPSGSTNAPTGTGPRTAARR